MALILAGFALIALIDLLPVIRRRFGRSTTYKKTPVELPAFFMKAIFT